jgi:circadian clock protein KaiC
MRDTDRVATGVPALDEMLSGGLLAGSVNLVSGSPGAGKSTLAVQFLLEGIRRGESGAYISLEEEKNRFFHNMRSYGWDLKQAEDECALYFEFFTTEDLLQQITDGYQVIDQELRKVKAKRLVVDSISAYLLACDSELGRRNELKRLFDNIRKWGVTAILTGESCGSDSDSGVDYLVDSIIRLHSMRPPGVEEHRRRFIEVEKMRGSWHSRELAPMEITCQGVVLATKMADFGVLTSGSQPNALPHMCGFKYNDKNSFI